MKIIKKVLNNFIFQLFVIIVFLGTVTQSYVIPSGSMKSTLKIGDFVLVNKLAYGTPIPLIPIVNIRIFPDIFGNEHLIEGNKPKRGEIVIFLEPMKGRRSFVKRLIAKEGDILFIKDKNLYISFGDNKYLKTLTIKEKVNLKSIVFNTKKGVRTFYKNPYKIKYSGIHWDDTVNKDNSEYSNLKAIFDTDLIFIKKGEYFMMGDNRDHSYDSRFWGTINYSNILGKLYNIWFSFDFSHLKIRWNRIGLNYEDINSVDYNNTINLK